MPSKTWSELLDDAEQEGGGFSVIPAGDYDFVISKSEARKTAKGKDMFVIQAKVIDGPNKGRLVFNNFVISPESPVALRIFFSQMKVLGLTRENLFNTNPTPDQIAQALYGKVFNGSVIIEPDNKNEDRNVIKNFASVTDNIRLAGEALVAGGGGGNAAPSMSATPTGSIPAATPPSPTPTPSAPAPAPTPTPESVPTPEVPAAPAPEAPVAPPAVPAPSGGTIPPPPPAPQF